MTLGILAVAGTAGLIHLALWIFHQSEGGGPHPESLGKRPKGFLWERDLRKNLGRRPDSQSQTQGEIQQKLGETIPLDLPFTDEKGKTRPLKSYFGKGPVLLVFAYYHCPHVCPLVLRELGKKVRELSLKAPGDFQGLVVGLDPGEKPEAAALSKKNLVRNFREMEGWPFLTGNRESIRSLAAAVGYRYTFLPQSGEFLHPTGLLILTPEGRISRYFLGVQYELRSLRLSLVEAGAMRIGTLADRLVLLCSEYDPSRGKYGWMIEWPLRGMGILTFLCLGFFIGRHLYREGKGRRL